MVIHPRQLGQVLADAMNSLARVWKTLLTPALVVFVPVSIVSIVVFRATGGAEFLDTLASRPDTLQNLPADVIAELARPLYISIAVAVGLQLLAGIFIALFSHRTVASDLAGEPLSTGEATRAALQRYVPGLAAVGVITLGVGALLWLGVWLWLVPLNAVGTPTLTSRFVALILLAALVGPGMWVAVAVSMTTSAVILESKGPIESVKRSMHLVRGRWWPTAGFLFLVSLLGGVAVQLIQLVALPLATAGRGGLPFLIAAVLGVLTQGLLISAIAAMYTHWYIDLRARRSRLVSADLS